MYPLFTSKRHVWIDTQPEKTRISATEGQVMQGIYVKLTVSVTLFLSLLGCHAGQPSVEPSDTAIPTSEVITLHGEWIIDTYDDVMLDPQTSGLKYANGYLYSLSDGSAHETQTRRLHQIDMQRAKITQKFGPTTFHPRVQESCFYSYLSNKPDYEALVPVPNREASGEKVNAWIFVTEDASRSEPLSAACQSKYAQTGSTLFPTLVVRLEAGDTGLVVTHARPVQFPTKASLNDKQFVEVGDFPNDGIEGLALKRDGTLLLGLEKDSEGQPRVFELEMDSEFWSSSDFAMARDSGLLLPQFESGNHPINGMDVYYPSAESDGYLFAAARNDNELWIVDLAKRKATQRIKLAFTAPSLGGALETGEACADSYVMNNASIEGLAVVDQDVWMVNDPWKVNYMKNVVCPSDESRYKLMAPLLFKVDITAIMP